MKVNEILEKRKELSLKEFVFYINEELRFMKKKDKKLLHILLSVMFLNTTNKRYIISINF